MLKFRRLRADEIECRISMIKDSGLSLLLYKDARVDQNILDETVGPMNWQRYHSRDNANCTVSLWDTEKNQWVSKEDTGTESYTEKEKGLASDSFKRACFNWGIGRELYSAPFIWVDAGNCNIDKSNGKLSCYDRFFVAEIGYDDQGQINQLVVVNKKTGGAVFSMKPGKAKKEEEPKKAEPKKEETKKASEPKKAAAPSYENLDWEYENGIDKTRAEAFLLRCHNDGVSVKMILDGYRIENIRQLTVNQWASMVKPENWAKIKERYGSDRKN